MKEKYLLFSVIMTIIIIVASLTGNIIYRLITHTHFSFDAFTFSLVLTMIIIYFYDRAKYLDEHEGNE